jgi:chaperonin GroES
MRKELIPIGDKVLIELDVNSDKTDAGLYLPQTVKEKERVQTGKIVKTGPGYPVPDPSSLDSEPWAKASKDKYFPLQAKIGDYCLFLRDQAVEVDFEGKKYMVVSQAAILLLQRNSNGIPETE